MPTSKPTGDVSQRRRDPRGTYRAILDAALTIMAERGPQGLSVSEAAHRAGVNRTTAHQYFRTRERLVGAVMGWLSQELSRIVESEMPLGERIDQVLELYSRRPEIARLWLFRMLTRTERGEDPASLRFRQRVEELAPSDRERPEIDPEVLACVVLGGSLLWSLLSSRGPAGEAGPREATVRFGRELKRLLALGAGG